MKKAYDFYFKHFWKIILAIALLLGLYFKMTDNEKTDIEQLKKENFDNHVISEVSKNYKSWSNN